MFSQIDEFICVWNYVGKKKAIILSKRINARLLIALCNDIPADFIAANS
jgi:hypothetical protein